MPSIELTHVTKRWGGFYGVDDLSLQIEDNAFVTLLGPSGCGKTTTLRMIAGLETPTEGRITIGDQVVFDSSKGIDVPANKRRVGFLFQNYALWPNMTVYQNIAFGLQNDRSYTKERIKARVDAVSEIVKIGPFMDRYPSELSGGQQQRVAIARTLAPEPRVLFMDEPLSNLDAKLRLEMRSELQRLHLETGSTFVYVTHDQMEAMTLATRICLMDNSVLQQYDAPLAIYNRPANLFVADFVGSPSINFVDASGGQRADGSFELTMLGGARAVFTPREPVDLNGWLGEQKRADEQAAADQAARLSVKGAVAKQNTESSFRYRVATTDEPIEETTDPAGAVDHDFVVGVRPEFLNIRSDATMTGEVYSSMPTGMETTVRLRVGRHLLTGVIFGPAIYQLGEQVNFALDGDGLMLFSRTNGRLIAQGSLTFR